MLKKVWPLVLLFACLRLENVQAQGKPYPTLRDFFAHLIKKENEQIVFKKVHP